LARSRTSRLILQALLGLLFLAWLPEYVDASSESPFLLQFEETLSLSDFSDGGEPDCNGSSGGGSEFDLHILSLGACALQAGVTGESLRLSVSATPALTAFLALQPATGPPGI
jgi:hypothetical protein